ncbi:MAG TPA: hypothetical protein VM077_04685 [Candidatus Limnocylindrales bacterium]|nr:hypothetical protein [Candidatus Limnocylindrales bacterium]
MDKNEAAQTPRTNPLGWIAFIVIVLVLGAAGFTTVRNNPNSGNPVDPNQAQRPTPSGNTRPIAPNTIVYGSWTGSNSEITAVDLSSLNSSVIASLPISIKKVSVLNSNSLAYIDDTNIRDHGKQIKIYELKDKKEKANIPADNGFGIDDYILSPNKKFMAIWEVSFASGSEILQGGRSRVYAVDLSNPSLKRLLYDEVANTTPIHYPKAILNNGKVFTDKFLPNDPSSGMGWAYGMGVIDFDGSNKKDVESMVHGTYGTQPFLSPDGNSLVFAGYDGSLGDGKVIKGGIRQALLTPNTVELLNTTTLQRSRLENLPNSNIYSNVFWDNLSGSIIVTLLSKIDGESGLFTYNTSSKSLKKVILPENSQPPYAFISNLSPTISLIGISDDSRSSLANLGEEYAASLTTLYTQDSTTGDLQNIRLGNSLAQFITVLPSNYFQNVLGIAYAQGGNPGQPNVTIIDLYSDKPSQENLQLKTFLMKPALAPVREKQQSTPPKPTTPPNTPNAPTPVRSLPTLTKTVSCRDLATEQCLAMGYQEDSDGFRDCHSKAWDANRATKGTPEAVCNKSPLYLYGSTGEQVKVRVQATIYNDIPKYSDGYSVTLQEEGKMLVNGQSYEGLNYDYRSNLRRINPPTKGTIVPRMGVERVLREYSKKLGLNTKETDYLVKSGKNKVTTPYVFISFFDHETSTNILPLSFAPTPDNYLNVVFYFKLLNTKPNYSPIPQTFEKPINRSGFTAIEISEIVE